MMTNERLFELFDIGYRTMNRLASECNGVADDPAMLIAAVETFTIDITEIKAVLLLTLAFGANNDELDTVFEQYKEHVARKLDENA